MSLLSVERTTVLDLEVEPDAAMAACRAALVRLGWEVSGEDDGHLHADEDFSRLNCRTSPSVAELEFATLAPDHTVVTVTISAPGIGPVPAVRAQRQLEALTLRIGGAPSPAS